MRAELVFSVVGSLIVCFRAGAADVGVTATMSPPSLKGAQGAQFVVTAVLPAGSNEGSVESQVPPGFTASETSIRIIGDAGVPIRRSITLKADSTVESGRKTVIADLWAGAAGAPRKRVGATLRYDFDYSSDRLPISEYIWVGLLGVAIGYFVRLMVKTLGSVPAPKPAPGDPVPEDGPLTRFTRSHYYVVDGGVTLVLSLIVMLALIKNGRPPDSAAQWYGALIGGAALGLLTNSELITKIPIPRAV
jgi:hypothetical protein